MTTASPLYISNTENTHHPPQLNTKYPREMAMKSDQRCG